jgi:hypothetical protein
VHRHYAALTNQISPFEPPLGAEVEIVTLRVAIEPQPKLLLAVAASLAPVPPSATAKSVIPEIDPPEIETEDDD